MRHGSVADKNRQLHVSDPGLGECADDVCGREFERHALTEAYSVPFLWWDRIVAASAKLKGWEITPRHFIGQDLADVGFDH
jgi:hypothetical protein